MGGQSGDQTGGKPGETIVVRPCQPGDWPGLWQLAALDSRPVPQGEIIVAIVGDEIVAALSVDVPTQAISDPFRPTAQLLELLELRARQMQRASRWPEVRMLPRLAFS
jgi:hypothetical protein